MSRTYSRYNHQNIFYKNITIYDDDNINYIELNSSGLDSNLVFTLPVSDGEPEQVLQTNGSGVLSWVDQSSGGGGGTGDITSVTAGDGLTGGATSGDATLNIGAGTGIDVASDSISVDVSDFMTNGDNNRILTATGTDAMNAESNLTFNGSELSIGGHIIPNTSDTYDLGSASNNFRDLYLSGSTLHLGDTDLKSTDNSFKVLHSGSTTLQKIRVEELEIGDDNNIVVMRRGSNNRLEIKSRDSNNIITDNKIHVNDIQGHLSNKQLAGNIANDKLSNSTVSYGGVSLSLGGVDATPAFDLSDATNYKSESLSGSITIQQLSTTTSAQLRGVINDETGLGSLVFATSPTLITPALGTPDSGVLTNCTGTASGLTAGKVTVTDSTTDNNYSIVFHDESNGLLDDTGSLTYNPSNGNLTLDRSNADLTIKGGNFKIQNSGGTNNLSISTTGNILTDNKIGTSSSEEYIDFSTSNEVNTFINDTERLSVTSSGVNITGELTTSGNIIPSSSNGAALGTTSLMWSDLFLASGGVINFNNGDILLTHSNNLLSISGGHVKTQHIYPESNNAYTLGLSSNRWADIYLGSGAVINYDGGMTLTHNSSDYTLDLTGASSGGFTCDGDITAFKSSDKRLKENIVRIENPIEKIKKIGGYNFEWNKLGEENTINKGKDIGLIAQEVEKILPEATTTRDNGYKAVQYEKIVPLLIECIKDQQTMIENLQGQIDEIKNRII